MIPLKTLMSTVPLKREVLVPSNLRDEIWYTLPWYRRIFWW